mgnify:CR=1 FL=1
MNNLAFIKRDSLLTYYALTFTISWGGIFLVIGGPGGIPGTPDQFQRLLPFVVLAMLAGPSIAGLILTGLVEGRLGFRKLLSRLLQWQVGAYWYAFAVLTAPLVMMVIPLTLSSLLPELVPGIITKSDRSSLLLMGITAGLMAGIFEELGWTGFVIPRLRLRYGVFTTGLIVGSLWGAWHILVNFWSSGSSSGVLSLDLLLHSVIFSMGILPAYRVLMVWVYDHTGSLLMSMLMHLSLTASNVILVPLVITGFIGLTWSVVIAAMLWLIVMAVTVANSGRLSS